MFSVENDDKDDGYSEEEEEWGGEDVMYVNRLPLGEKLSLKDGMGGMARYDVHTARQRMTIRMLGEYAESANSPTRENATRQILEALQLAVAAVENDLKKEYVDKVFTYVNKLAQDTEPSIRSTLLDSLKEVASYCATYESESLSLKRHIEDDILLVVLNAIADEDKTANMRVRKEGYKTLKYLLSENLVTQSMVVENISIICETLFSESNNSVMMTAAGNFVSRMASIVDEASAEKLLLPKISDLCSNKFPEVREACVHFLMDLACFVNPMLTENIIIPLFVKLSRDETLCVREACAETAVTLACVCEMESRRTVVRQVFEELSHDRCYEVRMRAARHLGALIVTFAQPALAALATDLHGHFILVHHRGSQFKLHSRHAVFQCYQHEDIEKCPPYMFMMLPSGEFTADTSNKYELDKIMRGDEDEYEEDDDVTELSDFSYEDKPDLITSCLQKAPPPIDRTTKMKSAESTKPKIDEQENFNSFQFWREPIPEFEISDCDSTKNTQTVVKENKAETKSDLEDIKTKKILRTMRQRYDQDSKGIYRRQASRIHDFSRAADDYHCEPEEVGYMQRQNIVPQSLLDSFIALSYSVNVTLVISCAQAIPAVLLTLGPDNWECLKTAYVSLASNSEKQVRHAIANSIHEIAEILGPELATEYLISVYNMFINDLEEIRVCALSHLSSFIKLLKPTGRTTFLPHLMEFMMTDYTWNWRFREQLSQQLVEMMDYFTANECWKYLSPVAYTLLMDRVSAVRLQALNLVTKLIGAVSIDSSLLRDTLSELAQQFAHSQHWARRQSYALLCARLVDADPLADEMYARDVLPHLLDLSWDAVPNVRIAVANTLANHVLAHRYFVDNCNPHHEVLSQVLKRLCADRDRDVRYYAIPRQSSLPTTPNSTFVYEESTNPTASHWEQYVCYFPSPPRQPSLPPLLSESNSHEKDYEEDW